MRTLLLAFLLLQGCGGSSGGTTNYSLKTPLPAGTNVGVYLTDQPTKSYSHVFVRVIEVDIIQAISGDAGSSSITISSPIDIDLLTLQNGINTLLGGIQLAAGTYQQLRLKLAPNPSSGDPFNYVTLTGSDTKYALQTPSAAQTGIKITNLNLVVDASSQSAVVLDFDANKSVVAAGNKYLLKPVIRAKVGPIKDGKVETTDTGASDPNQE